MTVAAVRARSFVKTLFPGYFALVMATGIIAIAFQQQDLEVAAKVLYAVAAIAYVVLGVLFIARCVRYPRAVAFDLAQHARGFAFLTVVAGTNVLGSASAIVHGWWGLAWALWWVSLPLWAVLLYTAMIAVVLRQDKPELRDGINGTWFLMTVATESIAVLAGLHLTRRDGDLLAVVAVAAFTVGFVLYLIVMTMLFTRWTFSPLDPAEADPPAWIAAGAVAITTLAGSNLLAAADHQDRLARLAPFLEGVTLAAWATATFWFPVMVAIGVWRHIVRRVPLRYHPSYWALVFPLGMYGAATFRMIGVLQIEDLDWLPKVTLVIAAVAWAATTGGLVHHLATVRRPAA